jgi:hypothetical protein
VIASRTEWTLAGSSPSILFSIIGSVQGKRLAPRNLARNELPPSAFDPFEHFIEQT